MGNCLKTSNNDDIHLIRNNESTRESIDDNIATYPVPVSFSFFL